MSETTTETGTTQEASPVTETGTTSEAPVSETTTEGAEQPSGETTTETPAPKPDRTERRIANLTRKMADEGRARQAAEARAAAAEALLQAKETPDAPRPAADIETRAAAIVAEREFNKRLSDIDAAGKKNLGAEAWAQAKETMTGLGAASHTPFLQALAETENPDKIFAHYADDTDALMDLLAKSPAALAAKLGRLDAELSKPATRPLSAAPPPTTRPKPSGVVPEPNPLDYPPNMSMREWNKMMDAHLPPSLGGKKKVA